jgi:hypothetical protein
VNRPGLLDLFCGGGGAARGYQLAGFHVTGVDVKPQPRYAGDEFHQADALEFLGLLIGGAVGDWDAIHASPPCKPHSILSRNLGVAGRHDDLLAPTRELLIAAGLPWVIENVPGAPMRADYKLCGCMFGLRTRERQLVRERWFETSWHGFSLRAPCHHALPAVTVTGGGAVHDHPTRNASLATRREAMGIDWMSRDELSQAIPPAYTAYVGAHLLDHLKAAA